MIYFKQYLTTGGPMIGIWRPAHQNESLLRIYDYLRPTFYKKVKTRRKEAQVSARLRLPPENKYTNYIILWQR